MNRWVWNGDKARTNLQKHSVSFELAQLVFTDPLMESRLDPGHGETRWQTIGRPSGSSRVLLLVVHTEPSLQSDGRLEGRIISARRATPHERRIYEERSF